MATTRQSRTQEKRPVETVRTDRNDVLWIEGNNLPYVEPQDGFVQRWVRTKLDGANDDSNIYKKQNQGWNPRLYSTIPAGQRLPKTQFEGTDVIGMGNMVLMERDSILHQRYHDLRRSDVSRQEQSITNDVLKFHDAETGSNRQSSITSQVHTGRVPNVADD